MTRLHTLDAPQAAAARVLIIACGALAREIRALLGPSGLSHVRLKCLPAILHNRPEQIAPAVAEAIDAARADYDEIFVAYADCGTGGTLDRVLAERGVERLAGPHCYAFFSGLEAFAAREEEDFDSFFLTDFLARHYEALIVRPLGLDRHPELRDLYFGHYARMIYLAQSEDPALDAAAEAAAARIGLPLERRFTGYGELAAFVDRAGAAGTAPLSLSVQGPAA